MSECTDRRFEKMLHHYELGILPDDERREFELHIYRCDHCLKKVMDFEETSRLLRQDPDIRQAYQEAAESTTEDRRLKPVDSDQSGTRRKLLYSTLAAAAVIVLAIFGPWNIEDNDVVAANNRLAIMYFANMANSEDPAHLGEIISNLLIADLNESQFMQTVTSQRLQDILKLQGVESTRNVDTATAGSISRQARARWMLTGSILQEKPNLIVTSQLVDVASGDILASQRVMADPEESLFSVADRLSSEVKADLPLPSSALREPDRNVSEVTTASDQAYAAYLEGVENYHKYYFPEAAAALMRAVKYDSTFAMAYYYLSLNDRGTHIEKAIQNLHHAGKKDQLYIIARHERLLGNLTTAVAKHNEIIAEYPDEKEARLALARILKVQGEADKAIDLFNEAIELDPLYKPAYNELAYIYSETGDCERALKTIDEYSELVPNEANPHDSRGEILTHCGRIDEAIESYRTALEIKPDFFHSSASLAQLYLLTQQYDQARKIYSTHAESTHPGARKWGRYGMGLIPLFQGRFQEARKVMQKGIEADQHESEPYIIFGDEADKHLIESHIYRELGMFDEALEQLNLFIYPGDSIPRVSTDAGATAIANIWARSGDFDRAWQIVDKLKDEIKTYRPEQIYHYHRGAGHIHFHQGNYEQAISHLRQSDPSARYRSTQYHLGRALLKTGQAEEALSVLNRVNAMFASYTASNGIMFSKINYYMAQAYEMLGDSQTAAKLYESFLSRWKQADKGIPEILDAKARLARLKS